MKRLLLELCIISVCFVAISVIAQEVNQDNSNSGGESMKTQQTPVVMPDYAYLHDVGIKLGCHFTLEYRDYAGATRRPKVQAKGTNDEDVISMDGLLIKLHQDLEGFYIARDPSNSKIIHLIQDSLRRSDYIMDRKRSVQYVGNLVGCTIVDDTGKNIVKGEGLVTVLGKGTGKIDSGIPSADGIDAFQDCQTMVRVSATNKSIRSIITECLPLVKYNPILWRAVTITTKTGDEKILVQFYGPKIDR